MIDEKLINIYEKEKCTKEKCVSCEKKDNCEIIAYLKSSFVKVEIIKGKFKGVKGRVFTDEYYSLYPMVTVFDEQGNQYWTDVDTIKFLVEELET